MSCTAETILALAQREIGTREDECGVVKYNTLYYGREVKGSTHPWCCVFVWWVFFEAGATSLFYGGEKTAYCPSLLGFHRRAKQGVEAGDWKRGDIIFLNFKGKSGAAHVGICESFDGKYLTTIEGNTGRLSDDSGGQVMRRRRPIKYVVGAYRPAYEEGEGFDVNMPTLGRGSRGAEVKTAQALLIKKFGISCGIYGADGEFGSATEKAVKTFQQEQGIPVDGIIGADTWEKLLY